MKPYGLELIIDLHSCSTAFMTPAGVESYCKTICKDIDMNPEDFHIWQSDPDEEETAPDHLYGVSAVQFITTSSLVIHTLPKMKRVYVNLFSCKPFNTEKALEFTTYWFGGTPVNHQVVTRI